MNRNPLIKNLQIVLGFALLGASGYYLNIAHGVPNKPFSEMTLDERVESAISSNREKEVVYEDMLGEGDDAWDSDPRYPSEKVNCIVWIQTIISESYGASKEERSLAMDRLRYYDGGISFGLRKHFGTRWMALDPEPLVELTQPCGERARLDLELRLDYFLKNQAYECPLYQMNQNRFEIEYYTPDGLLQCAKVMEPGYYFLFGVASEAYIEKYGKKTGPMGLVHGMIIRLEESKMGERSTDEVTIYHASLSSKRVEEEALSSYVTRMRKKLHRGYTIYRLDENWDFKTPRPSSLEAGALRQCERSLGEVRTGSAF